MSIRKLKFTAIALGQLLLAITIFQCSSQSSDNLSAEEIYKLRCQRCHGMDGKKGKKGAKDLNLSTKSLEERIAQIRTGKGKMPSFKNRMSQEQIEKVAKFTAERFKGS